MHNENVVRVRQKHSEFMMSEAQEKGFIKTHRFAVAIQLNDSIFPVSPDYNS